jgi:Fe-S cluster assembly iron-binding protein IscA
VVVLEHILNINIFLKGVKMLKVTMAAQKEFDNYFKGKEVKQVRIFLINQGCGGGSIGLAIDELKDNDICYDIGNVKYIVDKELISYARPVEIDYKEGGFVIKSSLDLGGGCSACGTKDSCCS